MLDRWFAQQELRKAIQGDSPTPSCDWRLDGLPYREGPHREEEEEAGGGNICRLNLCF